MSVMLVRGDSYLESSIRGVFDLQFGIRILDLISGSVAAPDFTIETGRRFIPATATEQVLATIQDAISLLIERASPRFITMETFYPALPEKALRKYEKISKRLLEFGYVVADRFRDGTNGIDYWFFKQSGIE